LRRESLESLDTSMDPIHRFERGEAASPFSCDRSLEHADPMLTIRELGHQRLALRLETGVIPEK
jgi:hypothetical protein